ncbi:hypothetical protein EGW08_006236 [Elysia chlorotica]|uniref:Uncharacterized protein n=1 Tax=Elysia chlorotica TaxID=188477 RepID=A0A3S1BQ36_ELYCH|nr:hypothetical protein EGW08_006236 [Elysia chlorotica]
MTNVSVSNDVTNNNVLSTISAHAVYTPHSPQPPIPSTPVLPATLTNTTASSKTDTFVFDSERKPKRSILKRRGKFSGADPANKSSENGQKNAEDDSHIPKSGGGHLPRRLPSFRDEAHGIFASKHRTSQLLEEAAGTLAPESCSSALLHAHHTPWGTHAQVLNGCSQSAPNQSPSLAGPPNLLDLQQSATANLSPSMPSNAGSPQQADGGTNMPSQCGGRKIVHERRHGSAPVPMESVHFSQQTTLAGAEAEKHPCSSSVAKDDCSQEYSPHNINVDIANGNLSSLAMNGYCTVVTNDASLSPSLSTDDSIVSAMTNRGESSANHCGVLLSTSDCVSKGILLNDPNIAKSSRGEEASTNDTMMTSPEECSANSHVTNDTVTTSPGVRSANSDVTNDTVMTSSGERSANSHVTNDTVTTSPEEHSANFQAMKPLSANLCARSSASNSSGDSAYESSSLASFPLTPPLASASSATSLPAPATIKVVRRSANNLKSSRLEQARNRLSVSSIGSNSSADILDLSYDSGDCDHFVNNLEKEVVDQGALLDGSNIVCGVVDSVTATCGLMDPDTGMLEKLDRETINQGAMQDGSNTLCGAGDIVYLAMDHDTATSGELHREATGPGTLQDDSDKPYGGAMDSDKTPVLGFTDATKAGINAENVLAKTPERCGSNRPDLNVMSGIVLPDGDCSDSKSKSLEHGDVDLMIFPDDAEEDPNLFPSGLDQTGSHSCSTASLDKGQSMSKLIPGASLTNSQACSIGDLHCEGETSEGADNSAVMGTTTFSLAETCYLETRVASLELEPSESHTVTQRQCSVTEQEYQDGVEIQTPDTVLKITESSSPLLYRLTREAQTWL